ncbi:vacuolar DHA amino acid exporter [Rhodotorula diobovata]|uniref:Vacuolar DHA amino acid exporter n=1 Tax=Rhodotorula diobovata TaxID=5288 RepID=A0A5C5G411_9BASI|nr:vacuolar DHA amino acid exporter [Rhodotorula diobovata]
MSQPRTRPPPKPSHVEPNLTPSTSSRPGDAELAPPSLGPSDVKAAEQSDMGYKSGEETLHGDGDDGDKRDVEAGKVTRDDGAAGDALPLDVEHVFVENDPRQWSDRRKNSVLATIAFTAIGGTITASVFFPALESLQRDLDATDDLVAATTSLFILGQGVFPILWSCVSEVSGRKYCYIAAMVIYVVGTVVCSQANSMPVFLAMRVLQSMGSSAVLSLGAGTLADMYDTHERGTKLGVYYACPLLGPALGPIVGGAVTAAADWRATFYFLLAYGCACFLLALWLPDTFRKERSLAWRKARDRARQHAREKLEAARVALPRADGQQARPVIDDDARNATLKTVESAVKEQGSVFSPLRKVRTALSGRSADVKVKIRFRDINPLAAAVDVVKQPANLLVLVYSGFLFASQYCISYTASRTFAGAPWNYTPIEVGLILLSFGLGNVGSVGGGRYSDYVLARLRAKNGGQGEPEMRIKSTYPAFAFLPCLYIAYGWLVYFELHIAGPVIVLFFLGAAIMVIYASTLAYIVDANPGRSTSAVACNSLFRGVLACAASQAAEPILDKIQNGAFYSGWGILLLLGEGALVVVAIRGGKWRAASRASEARDAARRRERDEKRLGRIGSGEKR